MQSCGAKLYRPVPLLGLSNAGLQAEAVITHLRCVFVLVSAAVATQLTVHLR